MIVFYLNLFPTCRLAIRIVSLLVGIPIIIHISSTFYIGIIKINNNNILMIIKKQLKDDE